MLNNVFERNCEEPISFSDPTIKVGEGRGRVINTLWQESEPESKKETIPKMLCKSDLTIPVESREETRVVPSTCGDISPYYSQPTITTLQDFVRHNAGLPDESEFAFYNSVGKAYGMVVEQILKEQLKESSRVSHKLTGGSFIRQRQIVKGETINTELTGCGVVGGKKWTYKGETWFVLRLWLSDKHSYVETDLERLSALEDINWVERFMSRYFRVADTRAYQKTAILDFRSRLYEVIADLPEEKMFTSLGWQMEDVLFYADEKSCPLKKESRSITVAPERIIKSSVNSVLFAIINGLKEYDFEERLTLLFSFGLTTWCGSLLGVNGKNMPQIILSGQESQCKEYADSFLKMLRRRDGYDILDNYLLHEDVEEYVAALRDDTFVLNCFSGTKKEELRRGLISGHVFGRCILKVPLVVLQGFPTRDFDFVDIIAIDLYEIMPNKLLLQAIQEMKSILLYTIESKKIVPQEKSDNFEEAMHYMPRYISEILQNAGAELFLTEQIREILVAGAEKFCKMQGMKIPAYVEIFCQRLRRLIDLDQVSTSSFLQADAEMDKGGEIWIRENSFLVPANYMHKVLIPMLGISESDFKRVRDWLLGRKYLHAYLEGDEYTRRVTLSDGTRVRVYELSKELFECEGGDEICF